MNSIFVIVIVALAAGAAFWWWSQRRAAEKRAQTQARKSETGRQHRFAGVQIRLGSAACAAARSLADQHFLADKAPTLPLPACTEARCRCSFQRLSDRRTDTRRWADEGVAPTIFSAEERRESSDRRDG
jgi:type II secretory pathway pseudopilin PulG